MLKDEIKYEILWKYVKNFKNDEEKDRKWNNTLELDLDKMFKRVRFFGVKKRYYGVDFNGKEIYKGIEL